MLGSILAVWLQIPCLVLSAILSALVQGFAHPFCFGLAAKKLCFNSSLPSVLVIGFAQNTLSVWRCRKVDFNHPGYFRYRALLDLSLVLAAKSRCSNQFSRGLDSQKTLVQSSCQPLLKSFAQKPFCISSAALPTRPRRLCFCPKHSLSVARDVACSQSSAPGYYLLIDGRLCFLFVLPIDGGCCSTQPLPKKHYFGSCVTLIVDALRSHDYFCLAACLVYVYTSYDI